MGASTSVEYAVDSSKELDYESSLYLFGSEIEFENDTWICDKKAPTKVQKKDSALYFSPIPEQYRELVKYFCISKLLGNMATSTVKTKIYACGFFLNFIEINELSIDKLNKGVEQPFFEFLKNDTGLSERTCYDIWYNVKDFTKFIGSWNEVHVPASLFKINYFEGYKKNEAMYIPGDVVDQMDSAFKEKATYRYLKLFYWIARSVPSRASEVLSMNLDCLKPYGEDTWVVLIPTWKQNGGYKEAQIRRVYLNYTGHGKYIVDLIKEQQKYVKSIDKIIPQDSKNLLFVHQKELFNWKLYKKTGECKYRIYQNDIVTPSRDKICRDLSKVCEIFNIKDSSGQLYKMKSHQLRHNGITDRLYAGFTPIQIMLMTEHQSDAMIMKAYSHRQNEIQKAKQKEVNKRIHNEDDKPVLFKGRILNLDDRTEDRLLRNIRAYKIKDLGICSDITGCSHNIFECFDCDYFAPDAENLSYFREQVGEWKKKVERFKNNKSLKENAQYNLELHKKLVVRIESVLEVKEM